jgi:hypothetical protein
VQRRGEVGKRIFRITEQRDGFRVVFTELPGVGVEVDNRDAFRERFDGAWEREGEEVGTDRDE